MTDQPARPIRFVVIHSPDPNGNMVWIIASRRELASMFSII